MKPVSIKNILKLPKYKQKIILNSKILIQEKIDGIRIFAQKINGKPVIAYMGLAFTLDDIDLNAEIIQNNIKHSVGILQLYPILKEMQESTDIPEGIVFQLEALIKKPTLTVQYNTEITVVLINAFHGVIDYRNNKAHVKYFADVLEVPEVAMFQSIPEYQLDLSQLDLTKDDDINTIFNLESNFAQCKIEGVVITVLESSSEEKVPTGTIVKIQNPEQFNQDERTRRKNMFRLTPELNILYFAELTQFINKLIEEYTDFETVMEVLIQSEMIYKIHGRYPKLLISTIIEDLIQEVKKVYINKGKREDAALIIGKFRALTKGHTKIINKMLETHDNVIVVCIGSSNLSDRLAVIDYKFGDKIVLDSAATGNLNKIIQDQHYNVTHVYCGEDRSVEYKRQVKGTGIKVKELDRSDNISATAFFECRTDSDRLNFIDEDLVKFY